MALIPDDEPLLIPPPLVATHVRLTEAVVFINVPKVDANGARVGDVDGELAYADPRLTDAQRLQLKNTVKFIARMSGVIT